MRLVAFERNVMNSPLRLTAGIVLCPLPSTPAGFRLSTVVVGLAVAAPAVPAMTTAVAARPATVQPATRLRIRGMGMGSINQPRRSGGKHRRVPLDNPEHRAAVDW